LDPDAVSFLAVQLIPQSSFTPVPWKNGGGITNEALREPPGPGPYRWRVSVAQIGTPGPFSSFAGYHRTMALLAGGGVRLSFADGGKLDLLQPGDLVEFDGAIATDCELLAGPCTDLNLIVSTAIPRPAARVEELKASCAVRGEHGRTVLLFAVRGAFVVTGDRREVTLRQWDLAVLAPDDEISLSPLVPDAAATPLLFFATLDDNRQPPR
jgi:environmental stress-induced protein Ves